MSPSIYQPQMQINPLPPQPSSQQTQFTDHKLLSSNKFILSSSNNKKKILALAPKQKLSQIIYNLKTSDIFNKYQKQQKQTLNKQWQNMKNLNKQDKLIPKNQPRNTKYDYKQTQRISLTVQLKGQKKQSMGTQKDKQFQHNLQITKNQKLQIRKEQQLQINKESITKSQQRKRSKTQMLMHDYELQKISTIKLASNLQRQCYNFQHLPKKQNNNIDQKNKTFSQNKNMKQIQSFIRSNNNSNKKSFTYIIKQPITTIKPRNNLNTDKNNNSNANHIIKRKISTKSQHNQTQSQPKHNHYISRPRNPISKSVMVQKIINLRKTFNDKYKKTPLKSYYPNPMITQPNFNSQQKKQSDKNKPQIQGNGPFQYMSFPVMNMSEPKKMTFYELFQHEKRKMQLLRKFVNSSDINEQIERQQTIHKQKQNISQQRANMDKIITLQKLANSRSLYFHDIQIEDNFIYKRLYKKQSKWSDQQQIQIQKIKSKTKIKNEQNLLKINSIPIQLNNQINVKINQNDLLENQLLKSKSVSPIKQNHSNITVYDFDQIHKRHHQKPQIKQLRHKYLHSNNRRKKLTSQQYQQLGISMISLNDNDQGNIRKLKKRSYTTNIQSLVDDCLQIEKKIPRRNSKGFERTVINFSSIKNMNKNIQSGINKRSGQNYNNFEPWQDKLGMNINNMIYNEDYFSEFINN